MRTVAAIAVVFLLVGPPVVDARDSGINTSSDGRSVFVQKDVGSDRWAIVLDTKDLRVTGNIFSDSQPAAFVDCNMTDLETHGSPNIVDYIITYNCSVTTSCVSDNCPGWTSSGAAIVLPGSFFAPDGGGNPQPTPIPTPMRTATPLPTPTSTPVTGGSLSGMIGTWDFSFSILSTSFTDTYRMRQITTINGHQVLASLNQFGDPVAVARLHDLTPDSPLPYEFETLDNEQGIVCDFHLWNRSGDTVSGITFVLRTTGGECDPSTLHGSGYLMNGFRTSSTAEAAGLESLGVPLTDIAVARAKTIILAEGLEPQAAVDGNLDAVRAAFQRLMEAAH